ncbi:hypothetical protein [Candidatus Manganitrophus noduliformans]|uniref:Porin n=1 Tax=Candidatus Manganitrophus noduliformans TaxID=2606439 RepID=A0A7X6DSN8_9BACT|nr:hypothetical protein [Candidatus Manganitrophus noduliformans]NKE72615.1 hypothetical protein [Candidatus Manganitrophus noduliformans]
MRRSIIMSSWLVLSTFFTPLAFAAPESFSELSERVEKIEEKNKRLEKEIGKQRETIDSLSPITDALGRNNLPEGDETLHLYDGESEGQDGGISALKITGFWDFGFNANIGEDEHSKSFTTGELDLFLTAEISEKVSFLTEMVFYPVAVQNRLVFEMQRVILKYSFSDLVNLQIGRMHTALGYWNHTYHHGTWLQTTVLRPEIYRFDEYDHGLLPVHSVGVEFFGTKALRPLHLEYHLGVTNGRGKTTNAADAIQNLRDDNDSKAFNFLLGLTPRLIEGLQVGGSLYLDKIPADPTNPTRVEPIDERIMGAYAVYFRHQAELLGEIFKIDHHDQTSGKDFDTIGFYLQGGYKTDEWTPYYRFDRVNFGEGDPYLTSKQIDITKHTFGLRWDLFSWNALKMEYGFARNPGDERSQFINLNSSATF